MTHCLLALIILVPIGDLCIFDIQYSVERTFIFSGVDTEKCCLISLTVELINFFLTTIWLPHGQLWAIIEGTASST